MGAGTLHRVLDVVFQYLARLIAILVAVPVVVLAVGIALDRTQVVTTRLWADRPAVLADSPYAPQTDGKSPAQTQAILLGELVQTDSFVATVLHDTQFRGARPTDVSAVAIDLQKNLVMTPEGPHVLEVDYSTSQPDLGLAMLEGLITAFQAAQQSVQTGQVAIADQALAAQLQAAQKDMDNAINAQQAYRSGHDPTSLVTDPTYLSLQQLASAKIANYTTLVGQADKTAQYQTAIPSVQNTLVHIVDAPQVTARSLNLKGAPTKNALFALVAVIAIEMAFVYNLTRRDQRVRTTQEIVASLHLVSLGTVPEQPVP
jgi:hypothetical protein